MMIDRQTLRTHLRHERKRLSMKARETTANQAAAYLVASALYQKSEHIACYLACGSEINTQRIIDQIWRDQKNCYLPVLHPTKEGFLVFQRYDPDTLLRPNKYRILEPAWDEKKQIELMALDLVIVPLVAFDQRGYRLGAGGGYYDRTFAFRANPTPIKKPILCGLAYSLQEVERLESAGWDVRLDMVVTETGLNTYADVDAKVPAQSSLNLFAAQ